MMPERASRTFICSVLFLDIVEYSRKPVAEQIRLKDRFNGLIASSIREIPAADRIILDTGDGVAINFLGDPEDALFVAMSLRDAFAPDPEQPPEVPARIGINLGPVRLVRDLNGQPNIIGDGINVAQRVMAFAGAGQILVSRSYFEIVSHISDGYTKLFAYEGSRTDKHVREHEIYSVGYSTSENDLKSPAERARRIAAPARSRTGTTNAATARMFYQLERWLGNRSLAYGTTAFASIAFLLALVTSFVGEEPQANEHKTDSGKSVQTNDSNMHKAGTVSDKNAVLGRSNVSASATRSDRGSIDEQSRINAEASGSPGASAGTQSRKSRMSFFRSRQDSGATESDATSVDDQQSQLTRVNASETADAGASDTATGAISSQSQSESQANAALLATMGHATVAFAVAPWGEVFVDGKRIGVSPPVNEVEVLPGNRTIEIRNGQFPPYTQRVDLKARQKIKIRYKFN